MVGRFGIKVVSNKFADELLWDWNFLWIVVSIQYNNIDTSDTSSDKFETFSVFFFDVNRYTLNVIKLKSWSYSIDL